MIKSIVSIAFATALMGSVAFAQTSTSSTTVATQPGTTMTTTTESFGTLMELTPGEFLVLKADATEPVRYSFGKTVTYVNAHGKVIEASRFTKDSKVRIHWVKDGDNMLVDKVTLTPDRE